MHRSLHFCKRVIVASAAMLTAMMIIWWGLWSVSAVQYRHFINNWIEGRRALGYRISYDSRDTEGFPRSLALHFVNFILQSPDGVKIHANDVTIGTFPWQWHRLDAKLKHGFELNIPFNNSKNLAIRTDTAARSHIELEQNGDWGYVNLDLADAKALWGDNPFFAAGKFYLALDRPETPPKDHKETGLTFALAGKDLTLPPGLEKPFGPQLAKIDVDLRVMGPVPDPRVKSSVAAWNNDSGVVEFDNLHLQWGPLAITARGTLGLDDDLQPEGAFSGQIGNHEEVLKVLLMQSDIPKHEAAMLNSSLALFAKHTDVNGRSGIEVPITVQLGGLFLGPVRIFEFPEIVWDSITEIPGMPPPDAVAAPPAAASPSAAAPPAEMPAGQK